MGTWIERSDGTRTRVDTGGLLVGRSSACGIVLSDPRASALHAVILLSRSGPKLFALGRLPIEVNGECVGRTMTLRAGDRIGVPGDEMTVVVIQEDQGVTWLLRRGTAQYSVTRDPFYVGGGEQDHLRVEEWPPGAVALHPSDASLWLEANCTVRINDEVREEETLEELSEGDVLLIGEEAVYVAAESRRPGGATQITSSVSGGASGVKLSYLPTGGRLTVDVGGRRVVVQVSELRCRLIATLLSPPGEYVAGELVPDEIAIPLIWPRQEHRNHLDLNSLIYRVRKDLIRAGLSADLLERAEGGLATRFCLIPGARVVVE